MSHVDGCGYLIQYNLLKTLSNSISIRNNWFANILKPYLRVLELYESLQRTQTHTLCMYVCTYIYIRIYTPSLHNELPAPVHPSQRKSGPIINDGIHSRHLPRSNHHIDMTSAKSCTGHAKSVSHAGTSALMYIVGLYSNGWDNVEKTPGALLDQ